MSESLRYLDLVITRLRKNPSMVSEVGRLELIRRDLIEAFKVQQEIKQ